MNSKRYYILISAGGTGGHMSPASATAHDLKARGYRVELITDNRGANFAAMFDGIKTYTVKAGTAGAGVKGKVKGIIKLALGIVHARKLMKSLKPDLVIGFGGYPSFPGVFAAQRLGIPTILHEQNACLGKANALLARKARHIALSMPDTSKQEQKRYAVTGNPVRSEITKLYSADYPPLSETGTVNILVMGGSLGATVFSEIVPQALAQVSETDKNRLKITQQCREADIKSAEEIYKTAGINAELSVFIHNIAAELEKAHLIIARSGASTVAEVSIAGRPAIYVPYPHHKDQQQKKNADAIAQKGGAWVMEQDSFTIETLRTKIEEMLQNPDILHNAAANAKQCAKPDAAKKLGDLITKTIADQRNH